MVNIRRNRVEPENLENWVTENREAIHRMSLDTTKEMAQSKSGDETFKLMEFEWKDEVYAKIYIHKDDLQEALENAEIFFVEEEMFEEACEARDLVKDFTK